MSKLIPKKVIYKFICVGRKLKRITYCCNKSYIEILWLFSDADLVNITARYLILFIGFLFTEVPGKTPCLYIVYSCVFSHKTLYDYYSNSIISIINTTLISLPPAVFALFTRNLRVEHPFVIFYRVSLLQVEFIHLIVSKVGVVQTRSRLWKQITAESAWST